jgi:hypothetical protein
MITNGWLPFTVRLSDSIQPMIGQTSKDRYLFLVIAQARIENFKIEPEKLRFPIVCWRQSVRHML